MAVALSTTLSPQTYKEICTQLQTSLQIFQEKIRDLNTEQLMLQTTQNWTPCQHIDHLNRSFEPLIVLLKVPKFMLKVFGKPSRNSLSFNGIQTEYLKIIAKNIVPSLRFAPRQVTANQKWELLAELEYHKSELLETLEKWSDVDLDKYMIPHPFMGKLTIREMLFFMICHVEKNTALIK